MEMEMDMKMKMKMKSNSDFKLIDTTQAKCKYRSELRRIYSMKPSKISQEDIYCLSLFNKILSDLYNE